MQPPPSYDQMTAKEYNQCVDRYADRVYRFIIKNVKNEADAHDIVQNAFLILWKNVDDIRPEKARAYLFSVAYNNMIDQFRKLKRMSFVEEVPDNPIMNKAMQQTDLKALLNKGLERLSEIQKSVILLRDYEGYSYDEIAEITELTASQVKVYIFRARKKLKEYLVSVDYVI